MEIVGAEKYLNTKKKEYLSKNPNKKNTPFDAIININKEEGNTLFDQKTKFIKYIEKIKENLKKIKNNKNKNNKNNIIIISYFLLKLYSLDGIQNKNKIIVLVTDFVKQICENIESEKLFRDEYILIPKNERYNYESMCKNSREQIINAPIINSPITNPQIINALIIKPPTILVISYDESSKRFLIYQGNKMFRGPIIQSKSQDYYLSIISKKIQESKRAPDLVVCCTQNSLSCTEDHFQHYFRELMEKTLRKKEKSMKYSLISKADATTENDSSFWSCSTKISNNSKPYNVRTRVYRNEDTLDSILVNEKFNKDSVSGRFNKKSKYDELYTRRDTIKSKALAEAEAKALALAEAIAEARAKAKAEGKDQNEAEAEVKAKAKAKDKAEARAIAEARAKALAEGKDQNEAEAEVKAKAKAKDKAEAEAKAKAKAKDKAEAEDKSKAEAKYNVEYQPKNIVPLIKKFYVEYIGFRRITEDSRGFGGILYDIMICKKSDEDNSKTTCFQNIFCNYNLKEESSKRILDALSSRPIFIGNKNGKVIKNELQIFMITPDSVKTKKLLAGEQQNIFENIMKTKNNSEQIRELIGRNNTSYKFKKIKLNKINKNVNFEEYNPINKELKILKIFNTEKIKIKNNPSNNSSKTIIS